MGFIVEVLVKEQITQYLNIQTLTHQTNHQQYLTLNTQHIGTIDLSSTVIYFITDNNVPYCCTPIKLYTINIYVPNKLIIYIFLYIYSILPITDNNNNKKSSLYIQVAYSSKALLTVLLFLLNSLTRLAILCSSLL